MNAADDEAEPLTPAQLQYLQSLKERPGEPVPVPESPFTKKLEAELRAELETLEVSRGEPMPKSFMRKLEKLWAEERAQEKRQGMER